LLLLPEAPFLLAGFFVTGQLQAGQHTQLYLMQLAKLTALEMVRQHSTSPIFVDAFFAELMTWELELLGVIPM
jgi:hypothetical protein